MKASINERVNEIIKRHVPKETKVVPFLMGLLNNSRESAYRRLRNEIPFTVEEIVAISEKLDVSVDEILGVDQNNKMTYFQANTVFPDSSQNNYIKMMKSTIRELNDLNESGNNTAFYVGNKLPTLFLLSFDMLSKLRYIKWIHQTQNLTINSKFSEISIPAEIVEVHNEYISVFGKIKEMSVIFDENIIQAVINTIKFYYRRNLISDSEMLDMKKELFALLDKLEHLSNTGKNGQETEVILYISDLHIESNFILLESDHKTCVHFLLGGMNPATIYNDEVCKEQKAWIRSLLKFSALTSCSNEILQAEFFTKQRGLIQSQLNIME